MTQDPSPEIRMVAALWHSNFRNIHIQENTITVRAEEFGASGLHLLADLANSYGYTLAITGSSLGRVRARFERNET